MLHKDGCYLSFFLLPVIIFSMNIVSVLSYIQFVVPGVTHAESSSIYRPQGTYPYWPNRTVDGNFSQNIRACLHTADSGVNEAWLRIGLESVKSVKSLKFWYRNDRNSDSKNTIRLRGYSVKVSNDTNLIASENCYTDPVTAILPTIIENECKMTARYIWFYQTHVRDGSSPMLEICEVKVFGCETGFFGENCTKSCDHCKNKETCDIDTGQCDGHGCSLPGYQPLACNECKPERFGTNCSFHCSQNCKNGSCHSADGVCFDGCKPGYQGPLCNQTCLSGQYGSNCSTNCGNCLQNMTCNYENGSCPEGCEPGYKGTVCKTPCSFGEYGINCLSNCSGNCHNGETCDIFNGHCTKCAAGYKNSKCDEVCDKGTYGENCSSQCGHCLDSVKCNHTDGVCPKGCEPGWQTTVKCDTPCRTGTFGMGCMYECSGNCLNNETCNKRNGGCTLCNSGWENHFCNKTCDIGWYGFNCQSMCGNCHTSESCSHTNGSCVGGCIAGYGGATCSQRIENADGDPGTVDAAVIAAPIFVVVLLVVIIVVIVILRRRKPARKPEHGVKIEEIHDQDQEINMVDEDERPPPRDEVYYNTYQIKNKHIRIRDLPGVIKTLEKNAGNGFENEFRTIPYGQNPSIPCTFAKLPENKPKNRFKTTFPYDHSRVILQSTENGDYINANFIKNAYGETKYIAAQGPKPNTVVDFWQMVWQENISVIAMVTNLFEGETKKCDRYWPEAVGSKFKRGQFNIQLLSVKMYAAFAIHQLKIEISQTRKTRLVTHLQYIGWPDHGTPSPLELLMYHRYVSKAMEKCPESKLVVHCSAGIGRTGTFIALDALHKQGEKDDKISIVDFVHMMREDRMNMIQNLNQYQFLYHALHESFRAKGRVLSKNDFVKEVESDIASNKALNLSKFMKEFKDVASIKPVFAENDMKFGKQNQSLNMTKNVLPADNMRIILSSHVPGRSTYYNAVPLSAFTMKYCLIAAQYPVQGAAVDMIRLLIDQECNVLVSINPLSEIPSTVEWFSTVGTRLKLFNYEVEILSNSKILDFLKKSIVKMKTMSNDACHEVTIYETTSWHFKEALPAETRVVLDLVKFTLQENINPGNNMAILSKDGATGCGVFCAVYNAIQQLQQDQEVDMFTIVRQLQSRRPEMIADWNEYIFCCKTVAQFIKSDTGKEDVYMNSQPENDEGVYANV